MFRALFKPQMNEIERLDKYLIENLQAPRRHILGHAGRIMIELDAKDFDLSVDGLRDECWKTAEWFRHRNPVGDHLGYQITGYRGQNIIYWSGCQTCRAGKSGPHFEHEGD